MPKRRLLLSWSSGKDSAWTLHALRQQGTYEVAGLLTTINDAADRVAMHAVRTSLLEAQAEAAGLPLWKIPIPHGCSNEQYEGAMSAAIERARAEGIGAFGFGDLFLEDIRHYREKQLAGTGMEAVFPLWKKPTGPLAEEMVAAGLRAVLTCVDPNHLPASFAGRQFDRDLLRDLPAQVDACGENGEFHSFAYAGPMFRRPISVRLGEVVERGGFVFADVIAGDTE
jgi:uncharacterized protein (TIGR00290 family)